jgi:hypothetical protein
MQLDDEFMIWLYVVLNHVVPYKSLNTDVKVIWMTSHDNTIELSFSDGSTRKLVLQ